MRNGHGKVRGVGAAPRSRRSNELFDREFQFRESLLRPRRKENPDRIPETKERFYIFAYRVFSEVTAL